MYQCYCRVHYTANEEAGEISHIIRGASEAYSGIGSHDVFMMLCVMGVMTVLECWRCDPMMFCCIHTV